MNSKALSILAACAALMFDSSPLRAGSFTEAKVTRIENQVSILKENVAPRTASVGDNVDAVSSVSTGPGSRVELQFPDKSITRLGANSRFTIRGEARTLDLDQGVLFLQVPKQMGGAKIRTGAITAAVTGTTVIIEKFSNKVVGDINSPKPTDLNADGAKVIVVEGVVEVYRNNHPGEHRSINAGEMFLIEFSKPGMPATKQVDIKQMLKSGNGFFQGLEGTPNAKQADAAIQHQQSEIASGVLKKLDVIIPGRGSLANVANNSSQVAHNAQLVHALNKGNGNGKGAQNLVDLLAAGNNGLGGVNGIGNGNGNGNGKGKGKGLALGQGQGHGKGNGNKGGNGNGNSSSNGGGPGNSNGGGPGNSNAGPKPKKGP